jgi:hypothetical protein
VLAITGAVLARRSGAALDSTGVLVAEYAAWVFVEVEEHLIGLFERHYPRYGQWKRRWCGRAAERHS